LLSRDQDQIFAAARELGIGTVIEPYRPAGHWQSAADIQATAAQLNAAAKKGAAYGVRVGYHNHQWELESTIDGRPALEYFADLLDPELVLEVDTFWVAVGGQDPVDVLTRLGDRVRFIHIKDGPLTTDTVAQLPAGRGAVAVRVVKAAASLEVVVVEFDDYAGDIFEGIAESLAFLTRTGADAGEFPHERERAGRRRRRRRGQHQQAVPGQLDRLPRCKGPRHRGPVRGCRASGLGLLKAADAAGVRLGCAPDTFLGAGLQTARRIIDRGDIGTPLTAMTTFQTPGPESWHPNPAFLFQYGAGPLFDMGPYYLTALVQIFGSVRTVAAVGSKAKDVRVIGSGPRLGEEFAVEVPTHVSAMARFEGGASSHSVFSFESPRRRMGFVEITGTEATISLPDPNYFVGDVRLWRAGDEDWTVIPATGPAPGRGMGVLDLARSLRAGVPHRAAGHLAHHVLDTMVAISESMESGTFVDVESSAPASAALPGDWDPTASTL
jgi:hypothetical protein